MPGDPTLQPLTSDFRTTSLQKINQLYFDAAPLGTDPALAPDPNDFEQASLQKINQLVWNGAYGPWTPCTYPAGCSGTLQVRTVGDPDIATLELIGEASSVSQWDATYSFILALMPAGLYPRQDRHVLVASSNTAQMPNSVSCAWFKPTGEIAMAVIYSIGQNPVHAWFGAVSIQV